MEFSIRISEANDAAAITIALRRSIGELCAPDHHNDLAALEAWLKNKTAENISCWLATADNFCAVAENESGICGVGMIARRGEILLCYLVPEVQFQGVGRALLKNLETQAARWGLSKIYLSSTASARSFYERHGYKSSGEPVMAFDKMVAYPYAKIISR